MSDVIHLLPDSVANQIAAGEVIQRPSSVVKELMENAVDAGASHIQVRVTDAGRTCIQVIDDGIGMSETDARLSFERHATSKIREASDLFALHTMGFRGEALPSIAAVSQVELKTRTAAEELGTLLSVSGSQVQSQEVVTCPAGSNFSVKNLFYNVPARRKFLKSNQTELSNILTEFERVVLVHPDIAFSLSHNEVEMLDLQPSSLRQRVVSVFGQRMNRQLLDVAVETPLVRITGFAGTPESARKKGAHQYFFVNGRYMRHPYFHRAVMEPYCHIIPADESVPYFIYLEVDPVQIDVNIHPTKTEIKFADEQAIWQILAAAVKESLGKFNAVPSIDFDTADMPDIPVFDKTVPPRFPKVNVNPSYNPFKESTSASYERPKESMWEKLYEGIEKPADNADEQAKDEPRELFSPVPSEMEEISGLAAMQHYQYKGKYIVTTVKSGLMMIHQQRAHIRILFDNYIQQLSREKGVSQGLLFPELFQVPMSESVLLDDLTEQFAHLGFDLSNLGNGSYAIQGVPSGIEGLNPVTLLIEMVHSAVDKGSDTGTDLHSRLALSMAKSVATPIGQVLSNEEMNSLIEQLFSCSIPNFTPDGKLILYILPDNDIDKIFK